ncbi:MAG: hypothetical protein FJ028_08605 [Chloroflexi bacterium]|nr:hypothetical protein [Chloroflexota bacterium]
MARNADPFPGSPRYAPTMPGWSPSAARTASGVPPSGPPSAFTIAARMWPNEARGPCTTVRTTCPTVAAFRYEGIPTTMSADSTWPGAAVMGSSSAVAFRMCPPARLPARSRP